MINDGIYNNFDCVSPDCSCSRSTMIHDLPHLKTTWFENPKVGSSSLKDALRRSGQKFGYPKNLKWNRSHFKFAFVRNTWNRAASNWFMFTHHPLRMEQCKTLFKVPPEHLSFQEFMERISEVKNHHWDLQSKFIPEDVDFLGRFETLSQDYEHIIELIAKTFGHDALKNRISLTLPHINQRTSEKGMAYDTYYDTTTRRLVEQFYQADIERFKHTY